MTGDPFAGAEVDFWNQRFTGTPDQEEMLARFDRPEGKTTRTFMDLIGEVRGKDVLDIGCGLGALTVALAKRGAHVTAVDTSSKGLARTMELAEAAGVAERVQVKNCGAMDLECLGERRYDLVVGSFILHHIEPFERFVKVIAQAMRPEGRGVFLENNAASPLLMFARRNVAGRFGIPKHGDDSEYPLAIGEIELLGRTFETAHVHYAETVFFRLVGTYVFRNKIELVDKALERLDELVHRVPGFRKNSYRQIVEIQGPIRHAGVVS